MRHYLLSLLLSAVSLHAAAEPTPQELEKWFNNDNLDMPEEVSVRDEKLRFITTEQKKIIPLTEKTYQITSDSLKTGWVIIEQCYRNLDPVPRLEVVYSYQQMRQLQVTQQQNVGKLWIAGQSIQMEDIGKEAFVCTYAEVKILRQNDKRKYLLLAGPFKRKFLDGYYPMHVKLNFYYPDEQLVLVDMHPKMTTGFSVTQSKGLIRIDSRFTGKLYLAMSFKTPQQ